MLNEVLSGPHDDPFIYLHIYFILVINNFDLYLCIPNRYNKRDENTYKV